MTARCGSNDLAHRAKTCRTCDKLYKARYNSGEPRFLYRVKANAAYCAVCGIVGGNSLDVPVYRYPLKRFYKRTTAWIGSIGLCDPCIGDHAELKPEFKRPDVRELIGKVLRTTA